MLADMRAASVAALATDIGPRFGGNPKLTVILDPYALYAQAMFAEDLDRARLRSFLAHLFDVADARAKRDI